MTDSMATAKKTSVIVPSNVNAIGFIDEIRAQTNGTYIFKASNHGLLPRVLIQVQEARTIYLSPKHFFNVQAGDYVAAYRKNGRPDQYLVAKISTELAERKIAVYEELKKRPGSGIKERKTVEDILSLSPYQYRLPSFAQSIAHTSAQITEIKGHPTLKRVLRFKKDIVMRVADGKTRKADIFTGQCFVVEENPKQSYHTWHMILPEYVEELIEKASKPVVRRRLNLGRIIPQKQK